MTGTKRQEPGIGGPCGRIRLPRPVESFLSWSFALGCLSVSGYHYLVGTWLPSGRLVQRIRGFFRNNIVSQKDDEVLCFPCWLPLTTCSRHELDRASPEERFEQFRRMLLYYSDGCSSSSNENNETLTTPHNSDDWTITDDDVIHLVRSKSILRRLASLAMRPVSRRERTREQLSPQHVHHHHQSQLGHQLIRIWSRLLELPSPVGLASCECGGGKMPRDGEGEHQQPWRISLIIPCYREHGKQVATKLAHALRQCTNPAAVQVVLVDAGQCMDLASSVLLPQSKNGWGAIEVVSFPSQAGRGPALNYGASKASGVILAFCHSDTKLPRDWDSRIIRALHGGDNDGKTNTGTAAAVRVSACAFGFGIDTSTEGLNDGALPPGIQAVVTTANLRSRLWSLPYGDQCLGMTASVFHYLGGFPHECIMEDYDLVELLRNRAKLLPQWDNVINKEALCIVPGSPVLCSPRRWQRHGVLYVTYMNSKLVNLYARGASPETIYRRYYGEDIEAESRRSPWEDEMEDIFKRSR